MKKSKFTGKHLRQGLAQVFFCELCEISKKRFFTELTSGRVLLSIVSFCCIDRNENICDK